MEFLIYGGVAVAGFVAGVLVGRRNKNKVELAIAELKELKAKVEALVEKVK